MARIALLLALLVALVIPSSASALLLGMGDEVPDMFSDPLFTALPIENVRFVAPYDTTSVTFERQQADAFLNAAKAGGYSVLVSFEHSRAPGQTTKLPSVAAYTKSIRAFMARYPFVRTYSPWDEANTCTQPTCHDPQAAASYFLALKGSCGGCTVVAIELLDTQTPTATVQYLKTFQRYAAKGKPSLYALHNYTDVNRFRSTGTKDVLAAIPGKTLWLTETGGLYSYGASFPPSLSRQAQAETQMFELAKLSPNITRLYVYSWTGGGTFDAGLENADGSPRPALGIVQQQARG
jgi:hypothetical protein